MRDWRIAIKNHRGRFNSAVSFLLLNVLSTERKWGVGGGGSLLQLYSNRIKSVCYNKFISPIIHSGSEMLEIT